MPKVSVVIPCYNYGKYLAEAVDSVLASTYQDFEIIIVDDGSNDLETVAVLENFQKPKTKVIRQENKGVSAARNNGIREANGEYILTLDADDLIKPTYIEKAVKVFEENLDIGIVYADWESIEDDKIYPLKSVDWDPILLLHENLTINTTFFKKNDWEKVGGYKEDKSVEYEDWEFWISLSEIGTKGYHIKEVLSSYRKHGVSRNTESTKNCGHHLKYLMKNHPHVYIDNIEYIIYPLLIKFMPSIPVKIKFDNTKKLFKKLFFSPKTIKHIMDAIKCLGEK